MSLNIAQQQVKQKFLTEGCGCGKPKQPKQPKQPKPRPKSLHEEVVNDSNRGTMTKREIKGRDRIKKGLGRVDVIKKGDTPENAAYRLATYIQLRKRKGKKAEKKAKKR